MTQRHEGSAADRGGGTRDTSLGPLRARPRGWGWWPAAAFVLGALAGRWSEARERSYADCVLAYDRPGLTAPAAQAVEDACAQRHRVEFRGAAASRSAPVPPDPFAAAYDSLAGLRSGAPARGGLPGRP